MEIQGKLIALQPLQTGEGKNGTWKKQECILEVPGQFPKKICFSLWGDKIQESILQVGNDLSVQFDIESREFNGRWYTEVKAWKVDLKSQAPAQSSSSTPKPPVTEDVPPPSLDDLLPSNNDANDLPF